MPDVQSYIRLGNSMLVPPPGQGSLAEPTETAEIAQGQIEMSNVSPVAEVTRLMMIQKAYDQATKLMSTEDDLRKDMLSRLGRAAIG